jgi:hypothetical protein
MFLFGEKGDGSAPGYLIDSLYGHFDVASLPMWGLPVFDCVVRRVFIRACGSPIAEVSDLCFGIYDATDPISTNWPLVATTAILSIPPGAPTQWWSVNCNVPLVAGNYALAVLEVNLPKVWSAGICFLNTAPTAVRCQKASVGGVFPDPLGICTTATISWSLYADDGNDLPFTPTAACINQPGCSCGG